VNDVLRGRDESNLPLQGAMISKVIISHNDTAKSFSPYFLPQSDHALMETRSVRVKILPDGRAIMSVTSKGNMRLTSRRVGIALTRASFIVH